MARFAALAIAALIACAGSAMAGSLWDYVHREDPTFAWQDTGILVGNSTTDGWQGYLLNVTSQTWLTAADTDHPVWSHQLVVIVPNNLNKTYTTGAIYVTGGGSGDGVPTATDEDILVASILAVGTQSICAVLFQVPNQPLVFAKDPEQKRRSEDDVVAFSWWLFLQDPSRTDLVVFNAMVKSVSKAMDAFQEYVKVSQGIAIEKFVIAGASKRGWTTWLTGAVDERVVAIAPIVMDMLNFVENVNHMYQAYGGWTFAFESYYNMNITLLLNSPLIDPLIPIIDPLQYAANLTMPKLIIDSTGDEFFMPDDDHFWWGQLPGETYRLMVSNAEHSMATGLKPVLEGMIAFYQSILMDTPRPSFSWTIDPTSGNINVVSKTQPNKAVMRTATTWSKDNGRRDFRLVKGDTPADPCEFIPISIFGKACLNPVFWIGEDLLGTQTANGWEYTAFQPLPPANFWRGFFVDMYYPGPAGTDFRMTTQVSIIPQTFPFPACQGEGCRGVLV